VEGRALVSIAILTSRQLTTQCKLAVVDSTGL
jgi:hypothetical protein